MNEKTFNNKLLMVWDKQKVKAVPFSQRKSWENFLSMEVI
jgi:hypothetical protein